MAQLLPRWASVPPREAWTDAHSEAATLARCVGDAVGAGGGFLVVPALVLFGGVPMGIAVGTSLVVIAMKSAAGLVGYLSGITIDWPLALSVTAAAGPSPPPPAY